MKIRVHGMLGTNHSWSFTTQALVRAMKEIGEHEIYLKSTNNLEHFPEDLKDMLLPGYHGHLHEGNANYLDGQGNQTVIDKQDPVPEIFDSNRPYDLEFCYTIFYQGPRRFFRDSKCRAIIWNFESSILPPGWHIYTDAVDYILPSSQFSYDIFAANGVPKDKMIVVPHGVNRDIFNPDIPPFPLETQKKVKLLHNAIPHHRKLHERVIKGYVETFTGDDDVCLVLKTKFVEENPQKPFEVDVRKILTEAIKGHKNPPEIEVINDTFIDNIGSLYTACDVVVSMSSTEGFCLPLLEALACNKLIIAPRHGGQLDFLNDENSLLIDTGEMKAPPSMQYWGNMEGAVVGDPSIKHFKELLRKTYNNLKEEKQRIIPAARKTVEEFSWDKAAQMILDLPIPQKSKRIVDKKRILYILPYQMIGGGEIWVRQAIDILNKTIYEPHVAFVNGGDHDFKKELEGLGAVVKDLSKQGRGRALKCLMEAGNYSIIHFYNSYGIYKTIEQAFREGMRCRIVETVHSELIWPDSMMKVSSREKFVTAIATVSNKMGRKLLQRGNKNVVVLPQHIDWDRFNVDPSKEVLEELNIPAKFTVGFVGRLSPEKNLPVLLKCAKMLPDLEFVIVGDGPQRKPLEQMAKELRNVHFVGGRDDVERFYSAFDLLMVPSLMEGLPLVILEAMYAGVPVIASDVGSIPEAVIDGVTGSVVWDNTNAGLFAVEIQRYKTNQNLLNRCSSNCKAISNAMREKATGFNVNHLYNLLFKSGE